MSAHHKVFGRETLLVLLSRRPEFLTVEVIRTTFVALDRTHIVYVVFNSHRFYDVPRVLIANVTPFKGLAAILDYVTHLVSMSR